jgi:hypothetical protein
MHAVNNLSFAIYIYIYIYVCIFFFFVHMFIVFFNGWVPNGSGNGLIRGMMKFAGYSLTAPFTPIYPNILKNYSRLPFDIIKRNWTKSSSVSVHTQKDQVLANAVMVAEHYLPPWFRWMSIYFNSISEYY